MFTAFVASDSSSTSASVLSLPKKLDTEVSGRHRHPPGGAPVDEQSDLRAPERHHDGVQGKPRLLRSVCGVDPVLTPDRRSKRKDGGGSEGSGSRGWEVWGVSRPLSCPSGRFSFGGRR